MQNEPPDKSSRRQLLRRIFFPWVFLALLWIDDFIEGLTPLDVIFLCIFVALALVDVLLTRKAK